MRLQRVLRRGRRQRLLPDWHSCVGASSYIFIDVHQCAILASAMIVYGEVPERPQRKKGVFELRRHQPPPEVQHLPRCLLGPYAYKMRVTAIISRHTFCYICIENWAVVSKKCPLCKQSLKNRKVERDLIAFNLIDDLTAKCLHPNCNWEGLYSMLKKHQRRCRLRKPKESIDLRAAIHSIDESPSA
jgi:hypothetical protein